ncbi:hypothetical protein M3Y99_01300100 [Aphelenchoides fujianensis]|nr:hypothetical protein M3Y99_01300100 [Aphelenchoides fujianensis]
MKPLIVSFLLLLLQRSLIATEIPLNFDWKTIKFASSRSSDSIGAHDQTLIYRVKPTTVRRRSRSISDAVIETVRCEHIELMDCDAYDTDEMNCLITATGMPCCICSGQLKSLKAHKKQWSLW